MATKTMSLRLDEEQARALDAAAMAQETTVSKVRQLRNDKDFQARLKSALDRNREALELLAK
jgi:hypothetical protein